MRRIHDALVVFVDATQVNHIFKCFDNRAGETRDRGTDIQNTYIRFISLNVFEYVLHSSLRNTEIYKGESD